MTQLNRIKECVQRGWALGCTACCCHYAALSLCSMFFLKLDPDLFPSPLIYALFLSPHPFLSHHPPLLHSVLHLISLPGPRLLEHQLQTQRRTYDNEVEALRGELQNVKEENNRQQQLLAQNLQLPPEARIEASLQHEITRLTNENLVRCSTHANTRN